MYHIKPIISSSNIQIEYPTSMYKLKPISTDQLNEINLNVVGSKVADVSANSSKKPNDDIVQQINNILKVHFGFQSNFYQPVIVNSELLSRFCFVSAVKG